MNYLVFIDKLSLIDNVKGMLKNTLMDDTYDIVLTNNYILDTFDRKYFIDNKDNIVGFNLPQIFYNKEQYKLYSSGFYNRQEELIKEKYNNDYYDGFINACCCNIDGDLRFYDCLINLNIVNENIFRLFYDDLLDGKLINVNEYDTYY